MESKNFISVDSTKHALPLVLMLRLWPPLPCILGLNSISKTPTSWAQSLDRAAPRASQPLLRPGTYRLD